MKRILFVDDEKNVLDGLRRMLHAFRKTWQMEFVTSGEAALQACEQAVFDVVVSDLRMPGMDGAELLKHIRDLYPATARIILSGYSEAELTARAVPVAYRVLSKPCNASDLTDTIERVCSLQDLLRKPVLQTIIGTISELPSLSSTYRELSEALRDPDTSIVTLSSIIERDVAMTAKILQIVNSGFFGLSHTARSLEHAVSYLGIETIRTLALYTETFRVFTPHASVPLAFLEDAQRHSQRAAIVIRTLPLSRQDGDVALIATLLHEVGTLVLASTLPDQFCAVLAEMKKKGMSQADAEMQLLGTTHAEIGAYLLGLWGINSVAVEAIAHHHDPTRVTHVGLDCSAAVYLSSLLTQEIELHPNDINGDELSLKDRMDLETLGLLIQYGGIRARAAEALS